MNRLEEIQEIIKNFIYEKQQRKQQILEIENQRTRLAQRRNEKKSISENRDEAYAIKARAEISELGNQISELGNQSQDLQNKLDERFLEVKSEVNGKIDKLISEGISEIREKEEMKRQLEERVTLQEAREEKYEIQKQEFFARFGRMPELSKEAQEENEIRKEDNNINKQQILEIESEINKIQEQIAKLARNKRELKNGNWKIVIEEKCQVENIENENIEEKEVCEEIEETRESLEVEEIFEENNKPEIIEEQNDNEEESIILPFIDIEELESISEIELRDIKTEEDQPIIEKIQIEEVNLEEIMPIEEIEIEDFQPIEEINVENIELTEELPVEEIQAIGKINVENIEQTEVVPDEGIQVIEETQNIETEQIEIIEEIQEKVEETQNTEEIQVIEEVQKQNKETEKEIITLEENEEITEVEENKIEAFNGKVNLLNIIAKIENGEVVYKAELSNGNAIKIYPTRANAENILIKDKENREELKEILLNYAIAEYRTLDKKVIKKVDPIVCEILIKFAKEYNYDAQNLIYNYAMSFSKNEEIELDAIPQIIYNFAFIDETNINKKEKDILIKICKNARRNEKIEIIGYNTGIKKIKYIFKRTFNMDNANALPEGKF